MGMKTNIKKKSERITLIKVLKWKQKKNETEIVKGKTFS